MASLHELQSLFASALRGTEISLPVQPAQNLDIYRNNAAWQFGNALSLTFPVLRQRVGADYFDQLARAYRREFPSRSGDLHWVGEKFASFLGTHLRSTPASSDYLWLVDLAELEWACACALVQAQLPPVSTDALAGIATAELERVTFRLQPSLHLGQSPYPVASVWIRNQEQAAAPLEPDLPGESYLVQALGSGLRVRVLSSAQLAFLSALRRNCSLGEAAAAAALDEPDLLTALQLMFGSELVTDVAIAPVAR